MTESLGRRSSDTAIVTSRKIACRAALLALGLSLLAAGAASARAGAAALAAGARPGKAGRPDSEEAPGAGKGLGLRHAGLSQHGRELVLSLRTRRPVPLSRLAPRPRADDRRLCLELSPAGGGATRRLCLGGPKAHRRLGLEALGGDGEVRRRAAVAATVRRPEPEKLVAALRPEAAGLRPGRYRWRLVGRAGCAGGGGCAESLPPAGAGRFAFRLRPVRAVGCTAGSGLVTSGPADRRVVALTFDDGPSDYTPAFLRVLREKGVPGTFFEVGQEMPGREATMRRILAEGNEIGDHTTNHVEYPGYEQIAGTAARIEEYTHFKPCLFRPPGGGVDAAVLSTAASLGLFAVNWSVDPRDWANPGADSIYSTIVATTRPGSIVLMHDGGGDRSQTLAALPRVIDTLRARGYRFATVTGLLGGKVFYRPYG